MPDFSVQGKRGLSPFAAPAFGMCVTSHGIRCVA